MSLDSQAGSVGKDAASLADAGLDARDRRFFEKLLGNQAFWVAVTLLILCIIGSIFQENYASEDNFYNTTRNFAFIGIMALGMTPVIITGGIDLSVGSVMGVVAIVCGLVLLKQPIPWMPDWWNEAAWTHTWWMALIVGLASGAILGAVNGVLIAYVGLPPFV